MKRRLSLAVFFGIAALASGFAGQTNTLEQSTPRPANLVVRIDYAGLPNCFQLTTNFYRGAQPTKQGMATLKAMGIKTVINLRAFHSDDDKISGTGMKPERLKMEPWHVNEETVVHFLKIAGDTNNLPLFVHCERGADRTGTMCALYRVACCGWTKSEAIREMKGGGFGFNPTWRNLVNYIEHADIENLRRRAGLTKK